MANARIPEAGVPREQIRSELDALRQGDADWRGARTFSLVYHRDDEHSAFLKEAYGKFFSENFLNPMAFKSLKKMESEVVRMSASMLHGDDQVVGTMTSGGTESLLLVVQTMRDRARAKKPWIRHPELVMPRSAHVAFDKAAHYFGVKIRYAELAPDFTVDAAAMEKLINRNTIMIAASAPQYPHGVLDDIEAIGRIAQRRKIPFHVDACIGGFLLPWIEKLGYPVAPFDFRVPGVTSISADLHKFGYAAKGASVILYRSMDYLRHQFFIAADFPGGIYASPGMAGTRPGGAIAAAWAALRSIGEDGYLLTAKEGMETAQAFADGIRAVPGLEIMGRPVMTILAFRSVDPGVDVFSIASRLEEKGWHMDRQQKPPCLHLTLTAHHKTVQERFLADLREAAAWAKAHPEAASKGDAAMYGMMAKLPARGLVRAGVRQVLEKMYGPEGGAMGALEPDPVVEAASRALKFGEKVLRFFGAA